MRKRVSSLFTVLALCLTFLPFSAFSAEEELDTKVPGMIINTEMLEGRDNSETGDTFAPIMQDVDETNSAVVLLGASKQVSSSAIEDFVKTAENKKGEGRFSGLPSTGDWCAYFVAWAMQNSTLKDELKQNGNTFSVGSLGGAPSSPSYLARNGYGSIYISPGSATTSKTNTYRNSLLTNHNVPSEAIKIQSYTPVRGDIVMFDWRKNDEYNFSHVGIMTSSTTTIEGNTNGGIVASHNFNTDSYQKTHVVAYFHFESVSNSSPPASGLPVISGETYPSGVLPQGKSFGLYGVINANPRLTNITAYVARYPSEENVCWFSANCDNSSYNIQTGFNNDFIFNRLDAGNYRYVVKASNSYGEATLIDTYFAIGNCSAHIKGAYQWYEDVHPHYKYWTCSICGGLFTDGSTAHVDTCPDCVEPGKPSLTGMKSVYASGEAIILRWGDTVNTTHINLYFDKKNGAGEYERVYTVHYAENGLSETFDAGEYRVLIQSTNSNSWLPDGSTWRYTNGDWVSFTVNPPVPSNPQMSVNKESIVAGEEITFTYGATDATSYYIGIDRDGSRILSQNVPTSGFTTSFSEPGQYSAYVSCSNAAGFVDSNRVSFTVNLPKYYLDVNGYLDGAASGGLGDYGTVDVYINGSQVADDVSDYYTEWPSGTSYEIRDIKPKDGYSYNGVHEGARTGSVGSGAMTITFNFSKIDTANLPKPSKTEAFNGHSYLFYTEPVTWYTAKKLCEAMGGHLVTITDEEENQFVHSLREENRAWIGATSADGTWKWITGEPFSYNKWAAEEPNNDQGNDEGSEHYTEQAYWDGTWNDVAGCAVRGFVCEIDRIVTLDINGLLDGQSSGALGDYGTADVYINGSLMANNVSDYYAELPVGTSYEVKKIRPKDGYSYNGVESGSRIGTMGSENVAVVLNFSTIDTSNLPEPDKTETFNGHTYSYYSAGTTWYTAKTICEAMGGYLATVSSEEENSFLASLGGDGAPWLGATDAEQEGVWKWVTGESFSYANWSPGEPNNSSTPGTGSYNNTGEENYSQILSDGHWNDTSACNQWPFICERDNAVINTVDRNGNTITVNVICADSNSSVFCGVYNNSGKMIAVRSAQITSKSNYQFQFDGQRFDYAKAFIVDSDFRPLCESKSS